jgi:hypothetical protein
MSTIMHQITVAKVLTGFLIAMALAGCGGDGGGGAQTGSLSVSLTDAPACGFDEVNITVDRVRVHQSSSANENAAGWTTIALIPPRKINLLDLNDPTQPNFALEHLGVTPLEAGHYTQVRLVLVANSASTPLANSVVLSGSPNEIALDTPGAVQSGIKLIHQFMVDPGQRKDLLLDFDACRSVVKTGNNKYKLKPVISIIPFELNGIQGFVETALLTNNVVVSAQQNGTVVRSTAPNASTGQFFLARLDAATNYDVVITADGHATRVIAAVPVPTSTSTTIVSTQGAPITLTTSPTQTITGTVTLTPPSDEEAVFIPATQTLNGGPTITVKSQTASVKGGNPVGDYEYGLTLPAAAPWRGAYSATLPIVLIEQPAAVAGHYTVEASAAGFGKTSSPGDISGGDQTLNFTLP